MSTPCTSPTRPDEVAVHRAGAAADVEDASARRVAEATEQVDEQVGLELEEEVRILAGERDRRGDLLVVRVDVPSEVGHRAAAVTPVERTARGATLPGDR